MQSAERQGILAPMSAASVVMPTYNKSPYLERTLASWVQQDYTDYELVLVDDGSADDTPQVIERYAPRLPLRTVRIANSGRSAARNRAIELATGDLIIFSD